MVLSGLILRTSVYRNSTEILSFVDNMCTRPITGERFVNDYNSASTVYPVSINGSAHANAITACH